MDVVAYFIKAGYHLGWRLSDEDALGKKERVISQLNFDPDAMKCDL